MIYKIQTLILIIFKKIIINYNKMGIRACIFDLSGTIIDKYSYLPLKALHETFLKN